MELLVLSSGVSWMGRRQMILWFWPAQIAANKSIRSFQSSSLPHHFDYGADLCQQAFALLSLLASTLF
jgi:hypothetical protein